jgi:hypothetical protein
VTPEAADYLEKARGDLADARKGLLARREPIVLRAAGAILLRGVRPFQLGHAIPLGTPASELER